MRQREVTLVLVEIIEHFASLALIKERDKIVRTCKDELFRVVVCGAAGFSNPQR